MPQHFRLLTEPQVAALLPLPDLIAAMETALATAGLHAEKLGYDALIGRVADELANGRVVRHARSRSDVPVASGPGLTAASPAPYPPRRIRARKVDAPRGTLTTIIFSSAAPAASTPRGM